MKYGNFWTILTSATIATGIPRAIRSKGQA
jgi:hypothetical protein